MSDPDRTRWLTAKLRDHYIQPNVGAAQAGGVFLTEVTDNGNWGNGRRVDALYVGFTSASGRLLVGHELKVSRADWLRELEHVGKADRWADQCHEWWLVTPTPDIVQPGELPAGWGHMVPPARGRRFKALVTPTRHTRRNPDWHTARAILAKADTLTTQDIQQRVYAEVAKRTAPEAKREDGRMQDLIDRAARAERRVDTLSKALGGFRTIGWSRGDDTELDQETAAALANVRRVLESTSNVNQALDMIHGRFANPVANARRALELLEHELSAINRQEAE